MGSEEETAAVVGSEAVAATGWAAQEAVTEAEGSAAAAATGAGATAEEGSVEGANRP